MKIEWTRNLFKKSDIPCCVAVLNLKVNKTWLGMAPQHEWKYFLDLSDNSVFTFKEVNL